MHMHDRLMTMHTQAGTMEELDQNATRYKFARTTTVATDTLMQSGLGVSARRCGLSKCAFRPSDDAVTLPFHVPANAMMVVEVRGGIVED